MNYYTGPKNTLTRNNLLDNNQLCPEYEINYLTAINLCPENEGEKTVSLGEKASRN